jgi:hypothetical protein
MLRTRPNQPRRRALSAAAVAIWLAMGCPALGQQAQPDALQPQTDIGSGAPSVPWPQDTLRGVSGGTGVQGTSAGIPISNGEVSGPSISLAHEPPLTLSERLQLAQPPEALTAGGWLLYPQIRAYSLYSNNLFLSPTSPIAAWALGLNPSLTAEWSNGIHTTTLYGSLDTQGYPNNHTIDTFDPKAGFRQRYEMLRDLIFEFDGDYTHKTIAPALTSALPSSPATPGTITLPNGDTQLPNGNIISPTGQIVGHASPGLTVNGQSVVNPYDLFTGTFLVTKYLNGGVVRFSASGSEQNYQTPTSQTPDFATRFFTASGALWLGPVFYVYTDDTLATTFSPLGDTTAFRWLGGLGFKPNLMFGASGYFGRQGSESQTSGSAGGDVFGGQISYSPIPVWVLTLAVDETINIAPQSAQPSSLALSLPETAFQQVSISSSTKIIATSLKATYLISPQLTTTGQFGYTVTDYIGSIRVDNAWLIDLQLIYVMSRAWTLSWEYQRSIIASNAPFVSTSRNLYTMGAVYKF